MSAFRYEVTKTFSYYASNGDLIDVPIGFKTDFASVPWFFRWAIPKTGRYNEATVIHDYLCYISKKEHDKKARKYADKMFRECMQVLGCNVLRRKLMYRGVSLYTFFKRR
jgi:hypothetical protein